MLPCGAYMCDRFAHSRARSYALRRQAGGLFAARARTESSLPAAKALCAPYHGAAHGAAAAGARRERAPPLHSEAPGVAEGAVPRDAPRRATARAPAPGVRRGTQVWRQTKCFSDGKSRARRWKARQTVFTHERQDASNKSQRCPLARTVEDFHLQGWRQTTVTVAPRAAHAHARRGKARQTLSSRMDANAPLTRVKDFQLRGKSKIFMCKVGDRRTTLQMNIFDIPGDG